MTVAPWPEDLEPGLAVPKAAERAEARPDESWLVLEYGVQPVACCSLWWNGVPSPDARPAGAIGHLAWSHDKAAALLLGHALERLVHEQVSQVIAPFDGTLWRSPGWIAQSGGRAAFSGEPWNPPSWPQFLQDGRFKPLVITTALRSEPAARPFDPVLRRAGRQIRMLERGQLALEIERIHGLMMRSDLRNPLFSEMTLDDFVPYYLRRLEGTDPRLCLMIEDFGQLVATTLARPDTTQKQQHNRLIDTIVIEWATVANEEQTGDLPMALRQMLESEAARLNYRHLIHAALSGREFMRFQQLRHGIPIRRYALFHREL